MYSVSEDAQGPVQRISASGASGAVEGPRSTPRTSEDTDHTASGQKFGNGDQAVSPLTAAVQRDDVSAQSEQDEQQAVRKRKQTAQESGPTTSHTAPEAPIVKRQRRGALNNIPVRKLRPAVA